MTQPPRGFTLPNKTTDEVLKEAHEFYKALFTKEPELQPSQDLLRMVRGIGHNVPDIIFNPKTIEDAIDHMNKGKAPVPDSVPVELWKLLKKNISPMLVSICNNATPANLPPSWRKGKISLISKCKDGAQPQSLNDTRPITLLNTDYKIFSKALALHLGSYMPTLTIPEQRAFIHGRDIRFNIILAESLLYRNPQPDGALLSLDWAKAYDRVDYRYLVQVLDSYNFPISLLRKLLATMSGFELQIATPDGKQPFFPRERGVGQGCPCAPLLFALAIDPVARLIKSKIDGIPVSKYVDVKAKIALCADDTMIFASSQKDVNEAEKALQTYIDASGAQLNWNKSIAIPMGSWRKQQMQFRCPSLEENSHIRYLGIYLGQTRPENPWKAKIP